MRHHGAVSFEEAAPSSSRPFVSSSSSKIRASRTARRLGLIDTFNDEFWEEGPTTRRNAKVGVQIGAMRVSAMRRSLSLSRAQAHGILTTRVAPAASSGERRFIAIEIQRYWRAYKKRRLDAALTIQGALRSRKARQRIGALRNARDNYAARIIDRVGRGTLVRLRARHAYEKILADAADVLARSVRRRRARDEVRLRRATRDRFAATHVQRIGRRVLATRRAAGARAQRRNDLQIRLSAAAAFARASSSGTTTTDLVLSIHLGIGAPRKVVRRMYRSRLLTDPLDAALALGYGVLIAAALLDDDAHDGGGDSGDGDGHDGMEASMAQAYFELGVRLDRSGAVRRNLERDYLKAGTDANPRSVRHLRSYLVFLEAVAMDTPRGRREAEGLRRRIAICTGGNSSSSSSSSGGGGGPRDGGGAIAVAPHAWDRIAVVREPRAAAAVDTKAQSPKRMSPKNRFGKLTSPVHASSSARRAAAKQRDPRDEFVGRRDLVCLWEQGCIPGGRGPSAQLTPKPSLAWSDVETRSFVVHSDEVEFVRRMIDAKKSAERATRSAASAASASSPKNKSKSPNSKKNKKNKQQRERSLSPKGGSSSKRSKSKKSSRIVTSTDAEVELFLKKSATLVRHSRGANHHEPRKRGGGVAMALDVTVPFLVRRRNNRLALDRVEAAAIRMQDAVRATLRNHHRAFAERFARQQRWQSAGAVAAQLRVKRKAFYRASRVAMIQAHCRRLKRERQYRAERRAATKLQALARSFRERRIAQAERLRKKYGLQAKLVYTSGRRISGRFVLVRAWKCGNNYMVEAYDADAAKAYDCLVIEEQVRTLVEAFRMGEIGGDMGEGEREVLLDARPSSLSTMMTSPLSTSPLSSTRSPLPTDATTASAAAERSRIKELGRRQKLSIANTTGVIEFILSMLVLLPASKRVGFAAARGAASDAADHYVLAINELFASIGNRAAPHVYAGPAGSRRLGDCKSMIMKQQGTIERAARREPGMAARIKAYNVNAMLPHLPTDTKGNPSIWRAGPSNARKTTLRWRLRG